MDWSNILVPVISSTVTLIMGYLGHKFQVFEKKTNAKTETYISELEAGAKYRDRLLERNDRLQEEVDSLRDEIAQQRHTQALLRAEYQILKMELEERMRALAPHATPTIEKANAVLLRHQMSSPAESSAPPSLPHKAIEESSLD